MKKNYNATTYNLIALCHIIDDFEEFEKRLIPMISPKYNRDFVCQLLDISEGKFRLGARKAKKFYKENKSIIDSINKYSNISSFINNHYDFHGEPYGNLQFFYEYISSHKEEKDKILAILKRLSELDFWKFEFNEELDFTKETHFADLSFRRNPYIIYVAKPQVIPNYEEYINYGTLNSNYEMKLHIIGDEFSKYGSTITLNSLLFDPNDLPENVDRKSTFEQLVKQKNEQKEQSNAIKNSVDLDISILDLENQLSSTNRIIDKLNGVESKMQMLEILSNIEKYVEKLKNLSLQYESSVLEQESLITPAVLEREKKLYLERRFWQSIDID